MEKKVYELEIDSCREDAWYLITELIEELKTQKLEKKVVISILHDVVDVLRR